MRKPRYTENDVERAKNEGWRKGYADAMGAKKLREATNEVGYAVRLKSLKAHHANELREAQDQARNHGYAKGYENGVEYGRNSRPPNTARLVNDAYMEGREEAQRSIKAERKDYLAQIKRTAYADGKLDGFDRAIRMLKDGQERVLPF